jgi:hypothetical protein
MTERSATGGIFFPSIYPSRASREAQKETVSACCMRVLHDEGTWRLAVTKGRKRLVRLSLLRVSLVIWTRIVPVRCMGWKAGKAAWEVHGKLFNCAELQKASAAVGNYRNVVCLCKFANKDHASSQNRAEHARSR